MLTQLTTLPSWIRNLALALMLSTLLLMGGCTENMAGEITAGTIAGVLVTLISCGMFHACHF